MVEHQLPGEDHRRRVDLVLALVLRRRAVRRLEDGRVGADVAARRDAEAADEPGGQVADDVAVEVRQHEHVELLGPLDETHADRVDEVLPRLDLGVLLRDVAEDVEEEPVGELHDVRLRHARDALAAVGARVLEREADDPLGALAADRLDRDARAGGDLLRLQLVELADHLLGLRRARLVLDPGVEVFGVLADEHEVDAVVARAHALVGLAGTEAGVEAELVAERHVDGAEAGADRGRDRPLQRHLVLLDRRERLLGERRAGRLHHVDAGLLHVPAELDAGRLEDAAGRLGQLGPRPVAGNQRHAVRHRWRRVHRAGRLHRTGIDTESRDDLRALPHPALPSTKGGTPHEEPP